MDKITTITSTTNPKIKWVKSLHKNSTRRGEGVFLVEGAKEIAFALEGGYEPMCMFICPEIYGEVDLRAESLDLREIYNVSKEVFEKIAYRGSSDGLLTVFKAKKRTLDQLNFGESPFFIIVESVEKPGNLGAIIRTADGAGADAVLICDERTDVFNPNVIRSSVGTVFAKQVVAASSETVFDFLEKHEIAAYGAILSRDSESYTNADFTDPTALILGTEHEGLSDFWKERVKPIVVPMLGSNDSLNVSNAAAILAYEVVRQRYDNTNLA
jgi:TrmH family RNA methyltransferase